ncbi:MAG: hypothetical protein KDI06_07795, partial [Calditrichaeota bacterium]|nr:hypothetical protein [Calditrichota bacterium]
MILMIKISPAILLSIFLCLPAFAQIHDGNILLEMALDRQSYRFDNLYSRTTEDSLVLPDALKRGWGVDIAGGYQNGAPDPYTFTANKGKYWVSPFYYGQLHPLIKVKYRLRATNKREDYIDPNRTYWSDEFSGIRGDIELGALTFDHPNFRVKFGRDYLLPAVTLSENLLHSLYTYPYDQLQLGYRNRYLELSSYYLQLNATRDSTAINRRHLNGHRLRVRLGERGFAAVNEIVIYGGGERSANWMFLNPFLGYYVYQKNARNFTSNTIITGEIFL